MFAFVQPPRGSASVSMIVVAAVILGACGKDDEATSNGVNDVRKACEIRATWRNLSAEKCGLCQAAAPRPPCGCESFSGFDGVCAAQGDARRAEPSCSEVFDRCEIGCASNCACIENCYATAQACKRVSAARDGCVAEACASYCN